MTVPTARATAPVLAALAVLAAGCARPGAPSGGPEDRRPPVVASVDPEPFAMIEPGRRTLRVRYNERISERPAQGTLADAVTVSPRTGEVRVSHDSQGLDIEVEGGFREGLTYRVTVEPTIVDRFDNPMAVPFEWVFSTGDSIRPNAVIGQVWDATTGEPVENAYVELRRIGGPGAPSDTVPYVATTDSVGIFALRYLPTGAVELLALQDLDRDREVDFAEAFERQRFQLSATDTVFRSNVPVLAADTTRAVLEDVEVLDSLTLRLEFDDFVDPLSPIGEVEVDLAPAVDSTGAVLEAARGVTAPAVARLFHEGGFAGWADSLAAARDTAEAAETQDTLPTGPGAGDAPPPDTVVPDTLALDTLPPDTLTADSLALEAGAGAPGSGERESRPARPRTPDEFARDEALDLLPDGTPLPQTTLVVRLAEPLPAGVPFDLTVRGVINLGQLPAGGGTLRVEREAPEPEPPPPGG